MKKPLLEVKGLKTEFHLNQGVVNAVNDVTFTVYEGDMLGVVGESGCGKSVTSLSIMRLIDAPGKIAAGEIWLHDEKNAVDLLKLSPHAMEKVRGNRISMIFQDPMTSLNPVLTVGYQLVEPLRQHRGMSEEEAKKTAQSLLERVGIPEAHLRVNDYPHQFSGGMRQRAMVAIALACQPQLLIADEPTTALDVTIQAQIIDLVKSLRDDLGMSVIWISHDLGVIAELANRVAVMYAGHIVESGPVDEIFEKPLHPYTKALMGSIPRLRHWPERLNTIEGAPPSLLGDIQGCPFEPRCQERVEKCTAKHPPLLELSPGHAAACWVAQGDILMEVEEGRLL